MFWIFYNLLFHLVYLLLMPRFLLRMRRRGGYSKGFGERWGNFSAEKREALSDGGRVWVHAVSVGEVHVALSFIRRLRQRDPGLRVVLTVNTSTGQKIAQDQLHADDVLLYPPVDSPLVLNRVVDQIQPTAMVLVENEVWPNLCRNLHRRGVPMFLLNGRLSDRSFQRMRKIRPLTRKIYQLIDVFCMQSKADAERIIGLGAPAERVNALHSVKYEVAQRDAEQEAIRRNELERVGFPGSGPVLMGSSTWPGEEDVLCRIFQECQAEFPDLRLLLVPRHAERMDEIERVLKQSNLRFLRRTGMDQHPVVDPEVFILDTTGELKHFYAMAQIAFIGKSLFNDEGQTPIEAAAAGCAVVTGAGMSNFRQVMQDLSGVGGVTQVQNEAELKEVVLRFLRDPDQAREQGARAGGLVVASAGALTGSVEKFREMLECRTR